MKALNTSSPDIHSAQDLAPVNSDTQEGLRAHLTKKTSFLKMVHYQMCITLTGLPPPSLLTLQELYIHLALALLGW